MSTPNSYCFTSAVYKTRIHIKTNRPMMQNVNIIVAKMWTTIIPYILIPTEDLHLTHTP